MPGLASSLTQVQLDLVVNALIFRIAIKEFAKWAHIRWNYGTSVPYFTNVWNMLEVTRLTEGPTSP